MFAKYTIMMSQDNTNISIVSDTQLVQKGPGGVTDMHVPDDVISMEMAGKTAQQSTTEFVDDGIVVKRDESHVTHIDRAIDQIFNPQEKVDNIIDFLAKPIILTQGSFSISDNFSIFNTTSQPFASLQSTAGVIWRQKLAGFFGMRMDMRFRIVVNANKFQQGRYMMGWTPLAGPGATTSNLKNFNYLYAHNATLVQRTTVRHVELDLATNTVAELLVPFVSSSSFYPLNTCLSGNDVSPLGFLTVYPYSALQAPTGSTSCGYTIYVSFENVSLFGASSAQAGKRRGVSAKEVANKNNGPISGISSAISRGFKEFESIPLLGEFARDVSWISDRITSVASVFGFSKPTQGDCIPKMMLVNVPSHSTVDGDSDARALSYLNQPSVVPIKGLSGTDYDEMDFSFLKSKYAWFATQSWTTLSGAGTTIRTIPISPQTGSVTVNVNGYNTFNFGPMTAVAARFNYWRGSLKFRFKIVKTEFHSGRLEFGFYPADESSYIAGSAYVNRVIVDIRDHSEIEIIVPYLSRSPWYPYQGSIGSLIVKVVDPLVAPSSVASNVDILMEISGGQDLEFAVPRGSDLTPTVFTPQSGLSNENEIYSTTIGSMEVHGNPVLMTSMTMGDKVSSVRALLRRFYPIERAGTNPISTLNTNIISIIPDVILCWSGTRATRTGDFFAADDISYWASMYCLMSGGIRIRDSLDIGLVSNPEKLRYGSLTAQFVLSSGSATTMMRSEVESVRPANYHRVIQQCDLNNTLTVEVPQYTTVLARNVPDCIIYQSLTMGNSTNYTQDSGTSAGRIFLASPASVVITEPPNYSYHRIYRAGSDDFNLSCFVSVPPMMAMAPTDYFCTY